MDLGVDCIESPENPTCRDFKLSRKEVDNSLLKLCESMPGMPGCYLKSNCDPSIPYCSPFSLLASVCKYDMPKMHECRTYTKLCSTSSVIRQCTTDIPLPSLPTSAKTKSLIDSICNEMDMAGCEKCKDKPCELLREYVNLCTQVIV